MLNVVVSISGPSKSGKSVLVQKVVGPENLIRVFGAQVARPEDLWASVLQWMNAPSSTATSSINTSSHTTSSGGGVTVGVPGALQIGGKGDYTRQTGEQTSSSQIQTNQGLAAVVREISKSSFVVFVYDFHYIAREVQPLVAEQLKAAAESGVKVCVASVPHRSGDVVRANPELRGRLLAVDMNFWRPEELEQIALKGFSVLNAQIDDRLVKKFSIDACGSPQLMQSLCMNWCFVNDIEGVLDAPMQLDFDEGKVQKALRQTSQMTPFRDMVKKCMKGQNHEVRSGSNSTSRMGAVAMYTGPSC